MVQVDGFMVQGCSGGFAANIRGDARRRFKSLQSPVTSHQSPVTSHQSPVTHRLHPPGVFCQLKNEGNTDPLIIRGDPRFLKETAGTHAGPWTTSKSVLRAIRAMPTHCQMGIRPFSATPFAFLAYCSASSVIFLTTSSLPASV